MDLEQIINRNKDKVLEVVKELFQNQHVLDKDLFKDQNFDFDESTMEEILTFFIQILNINKNTYTKYKKTLFKKKMKDAYMDIVVNFEERRLKKLFTKAPLVSDLMQDDNTPINFDTEFYPIYQKGDFSAKQFVASKGKFESQVYINKNTFDKRHTNMLNDQQDEFQANVQRYLTFADKYIVYLKQQPEFQVTIDENFPNLEKLVFIGRVQIFKNSHTQEQEIFLEYQTSSGFSLIRADFQKITTMCIFPNQILIVRGECLMKTFMVEVVINSLEFTQENQVSGFHVELEVLKHNTGVMIIRGPFYTSNIDWDDMQAFLFKQVKNYQVKVLIIKGPIISNMNKRKKEESSYFQIQKDFFDMFANSENLGIEVVYIPDTDEINSNMIFPNAPFHSTGPVKQGSNPCIVQIGHFLMGFTDNVLLDETMAYGKQFHQNEEEKLTICLRSLLEQRNLHPCIADDSFLSVLNCDNMSYTSDLDFLFISSRKQQSFIKQVGKTLCVNLNTFFHQKNIGEIGLVYLSTDNKARVEIHGNRRIK